jgi:hypothetical protein
MSSTPTSPPGTKENQRSYYRCANSRCHFVDTPPGVLSCQIALQMGLHSLVLVLASRLVTSQRILTSSPVSVESPEYSFPGNSHGCGQIRSSHLSELTVDMSSNTCGGGKVQCPRCFVFHVPIKLFVKQCESPPRTARCQETGVCPVQQEEEVRERFNEYVFINMSEGVVFAGSAENDLSTGIAPNSSRTAICYQGKFFWS